MYKKILEFKSAEIIRAAGLELPVEVEKTVVLNDGKLVFMVRFHREGASYYAAVSSFSNVD